MTRRIHLGMLTGVALALLLQGTAAAATAQVSIVNLAFNPSSVKIRLGDSVNWTNNEDHPPREHTSTGDGAPDGGGSSGVGLWSSGGILARGGQFAFTFTFAGTFPYHCSFHPIMTGSVSVPPKASPATGPAGTKFKIRVSTVDLTGSDFQIVIQKSDPGGPFTNWRTASTGTSKTFDSTGVAPGTYRFRAILHRISTGENSGASPPSAVTVT